MRRSIFSPEWVSLPGSFPGGFITARWALRNATSRSNFPWPGSAETVVFAYVDPGHATAVELNTWGAAHGALWAAIRAAGRRVVVAAIAAELDRVMRSERVLQLWAEADPGKPVPGVPVKQEIALLKKALLDQDDELFVGYGGEQGVVDRYLELQKLPEAGLAEGVKIDDYSTYRATRFAEVE